MYNRLPLIGCVVSLLFSCGCCRLQVAPERTRGKVAYSDYVATALEYDAKTDYVARRGDEFWIRFFKDKDVPFPRKWDLMKAIDAVSQEPKEQGYPPGEDGYGYFAKYSGMTNSDLLDIFVKTRNQHKFHEAFLVLEEIDKNFLFRELQEGLGGFEVSKLTELAALYGEDEWKAILSDFRIQTCWKFELILDIDDYVASDKGF